MFKTFFFCVATLFCGSMALTTLIGGITGHVPLDLLLPIWLTFVVLGVAAAFKAESLISTL